ncbi:SLC13 family permease [Clostridium vitabionis]|uniref:SLC13 family permease n=1 Tax=Clostridium vitabionis TaxID=2784388 RepID=UPI00188CC25B|nr:SLC13 family permease [Clostridium vitabionis]
MSPTVVAILLIVIVIAAILWNKIPMNFIMFVVPVACAFLLGYNLTEISNVILAQIATVMKSAGWMLMFGLIYFTMLTETGMFDTIIERFIKLLGGKLNVVTIMVITTIVSAVAYLTANISTAYLIVFPIMLPLFLRYKMDNRWLFIICQTAISAMCWLPWGIGVVNSAMMAGVSPEELAKASMPWGAAFIPAIILQWVYFAMVYRKQNGSLSIQAAGVAEEKEKEANPNNRPKLFWFNLIVFAIVVYLLAVIKMPSYIVFIGASIVTAMVNYRTDFGKIWNKAGMTFFNVLIMLFAICFYLAVFNMCRTTDPSGAAGSLVSLSVAKGAEVLKPSMVSSLADTLVTHFPPFLMKNMYVIFLLVVVPVIYFVPYQLYNAMYPVFISIGAAFGLGSMAIIAPFVCNLALATSNTPMNSATYVGCSLLDIKDVKGYCTYAGKMMFVTNLVVMLVAIATGLLKL